MGMLYVVPTPVGNLEDITERALKVLKSVDTVLAEDTRTSGMLLKHYGISAKLCAHHKFNEHQTAEAFSSRMAKTLQQFAEVFGKERRASVTREISKIHEETTRGTLEELSLHFTETEPKGEFVIVVEGMNRKIRNNETKK